MKKNAIREQVEKHLGDLGFAADAWAWSRNELLIAAGGVLRRIKLPSGTAKRDVHFALGRISGWADIAPPSQVFHGSGEWIKPAGFTPVLVTAQAA